MIHLTRGKKVASIYLGSLYVRLDKCVADPTRSLGRYDIVAHVDFVFLQMFMWECFGLIAPVLVEYATIPKGTRVVSPTKRSYKAPTVRSMCTLTSLWRSNQLTSLWMGS